MQDKVLVITGANSFIGRKILNFFLKKNYKVYSIYNSRKIKHKKIINIKINFEEKKIDFKDLNNINPTYIVHAAWNTVNNDYLNSEKNNIWLKNSINFFKTFKNFSKIKVIILGTCAEYNWNSKKILKEKYNYKPANNYGKAKRNLYLKLKYNLNIKKILWLRLFYLFGKSSKNKSLVKSSRREFEKKRDFLLKNNNSIDYIYDEDAANIVMNIIQKNIFEIFNISSGKAIKNTEFVNMVKKLTNKNCNINKIKNNKNYTIHGSNMKLIDNNIISSKKFLDYKDYIQTNLKKTFEIN